MSEMKPLQPETSLDIQHGPASTPSRRLRPGQFGLRALLGAITLCCGLLALAAWSAAGWFITVYLGLCLFGGGALAWFASPKNARRACLAVALLGSAMILWGVGIIAYHVVTFAHVDDPAESLPTK